MTNTRLDEVLAGIAQGLIDPSFFRTKADAPPDAAQIAALLNQPARFATASAATFDGRAYLERYPDLQDSAMHPVVHFLRHGRAEGRQAFGEWASALQMVQDNDKPLWLESHDLSLTGAPIALGHILQGWPDLGRAVCLGAPCDGPLRARLTSLAQAPILHGQSALRCRSLTKARAMADHCAALLQTARVRGVIGNSFLAWPMVMAAQQIGLPTSWIIHEPNNAEMVDLFDADLMAHLMGMMGQVDRLIFVSANSRKAWGAAASAAVIPKALPPAPQGNRAAGRSAAQCGAKDILILNVGSISPRKGQADLISALEILAGSDIANRLVTVIIGHNPSPYAADIRSRLSALRARGMRLFLLPESKTPAERRRVEHLFAAADIFAMTSRAESLPLTTAEAMAAHCPVISTDAPGIGEMVQHQVTGLHYRAGDVAALAAALTDLARGDHLRAQMRQAIADSLDPAAFDRMIAAYRAALPALQANMQN